MLNASYEPLQFCTWKRAVALVLKEKADTLETNPNYKLNTFFDMPVVIRLKYYVKVPYQSVPLNRKNLLHRDGHRCQYCGKENEPLSVDHVFPKSRGGKDDWENLVIACKNCNVKKGSRTPEEAGFTLLQKPFRPAHYTVFELSKVTAIDDHRPVWQKYMLMEA